MKVHVVGYEISQGISKKTGSPYSIGKLHGLLPIAGANSRGCMSSEYPCEPAMLQKLQDVELPCWAEVEMQQVMRYGQRREEVVSVVPTSSPLPPAKTAASR